jgi:hypothetical protein
VFERIYANHEWSGISRSGPGSDPLNTRTYVQFVKSWLDAHEDVRTVVEIGCGDWSTTREIRLGSRYSYLGIDIVESVIRENATLYESAYTLSIRILSRRYRPQQMS